MSDATSYAIYEAALGTLKLDYEGDAITGITFFDPFCLEHYELSRGSVQTSFTDGVAQQLEEYFAAQRRSFDFPLLLKGTEFQRKVWQALLEIPYGETRSYQEIAEAIGCPKALRSVGSANRANPLPIVIPCHRVITKGGALGSYALGAQLKENLLALEFHSCARCPSCESGRAQ